MRILLTDIDDCVLSWISGFAIYTERKLGYKPKGKPDAWHMERWLGVTTQQAEEMVKEFNHESWEFGCLPPMAGAEEVLPDLAKEMKIIGITCCSTEQVTKSLRMANLYNKLGPVFSHVEFLPLGSSKKSTLDSWCMNGKVMPHIAGWVEDKPSAALDGKAFGMKSFLMRQKHNESFEKENPNALIYVDSWFDIVNHLESKHDL